jgi:hypothetical protein
MPAIDVCRCAEYASACALCRKLTGAAPSKQVFELCHKILESRRSPRRSIVPPARRPRAPSKKTWAGLVTRRTALANASIALPDDLGDAACAGVGDVLDAGVAAWSASRYARNVAKRFGLDARDHDRRTRGIWY